MSDYGRTSSAWLFFAALIFMILGLTYNPIFFALAIFLFSAAEARRNKTVGTIGMAFGLLFLFLVLGYGVGKDAAHRENAQSSIPSSSDAP